VKVNNSVTTTSYNSYSSNSSISIINNNIYNNSNSSISISINNNSLESRDFPFAKKVFSLAKGW